MGEGNVHEHRPPVSRRQVIRRGMVAGGVALWSAPWWRRPRSAVTTPVRPPTASAAQMAQATWAPRLGRRPRRGRGGGSQAGAGQPVRSFPRRPWLHQLPAGHVHHLRLRRAVHVLWPGRGRVRCFCDVDATDSCVCRNDADCSDLATAILASATATAPPGTSASPRAAVPGPSARPRAARCPPGARNASTMRNFLPILNSILPPWHPERPLAVPGAAAGGGGFPRRYGGGRAGESPIRRG